MDSIDSYSRGTRCLKHWSSCRHSGPGRAAERAFRPVWRSRPACPIRSSRSPSSDRGHGRSEPTCYRSHSSGTGFWPFWCSFRLSVMSRLLLNAFGAERPASLYCCTNNARTKRTCIGYCHVPLVSNKSRSHITRVLDLGSVRTMLTTVPP